MTLHDVGHVLEAVTGVAAGPQVAGTLDDAAAHLFGHPDAGVAHLDHHPPRFLARGSDRQRAALGHGGQGVQDEPQDRIAQLEAVALDGRQRLQVLGDGDHDATPLGLVPPARGRHLHRLRDHRGEPDRAERHLGLARDELLQPLYGN